MSDIPEHLKDWASRATDDILVVTDKRHLAARITGFLEAAIGFGMEVTQQPIPMRIPCPSCGKLHIDEGEFATKLHHTHACQYCGEVFRNALVNTVGVQFLPGFQNEKPIAEFVEPPYYGCKWQLDFAGVEIKPFDTYVYKLSPKVYFKPERLTATDTAMIAEVVCGRNGPPFYFPLAKATQPDYNLCAIDDEMKIVIFNPNKFTIRWSAVFHGKARW